LKEQEEFNRWFASLSAKEQEDWKADQKAEQVRRAEAEQERKKEYTRKLDLQRQELVADSRLMAGYLQSEIASAIAWTGCGSDRTGWFW
jgi:hypothetical protein